MTAASRQLPVVSRLFLLALLLFSLCVPVAAQTDCATPREMAPAAATGRLAVVTWNVHGMPFDGTLDARIDNISNEILRRRPDLVLLQEAWTRSGARRFDCRLRGEYQIVADGEGVDAGALSLYGHRRGGLLALVRRDSPWRIDEAVPPQFTEYEVSGPLYRLFSERDAVAGKGIQNFAIGDGEVRVAVLNTHLQSQYGQRWYTEVRQAQIWQLLEHANGRPADVTVVAGDFNTSPRETALYGELTRDFRDLTADYQRNCRCGTLAGPNRRTRHWFDYVFARSGAAVQLESKADLILNTAVREPYSDHHGVWVEMRIAR